MPTNLASTSDLQGKGPVRTCIGCRERDLRSVLLRLVVDRSGTDDGEPRLVVDVGRSRPGRGAWLHATTRCLEAAERRRAVPRALRLAGPLDLADVRAVVEARRGEDGLTARHDEGPDQPGPGGPVAAQHGRTARHVDKEAG